MHCPRSPSAFTIVELLVVITIIVLLLALLTPAMNQAIYQAELAVCGAKQKGIVSAALSYAWDHQRHYPTRNPLFIDQAWLMRWKDQNSYPFDLVTLYEPYTASRDLFLDPLCGRIDLSERANKPNTLLYGNYDLYPGRPFDRGSSFRAMNRIGQWYNWNDTISSSSGSLHNFSVIAGDHDMYWYDNNRNRQSGSHADALDVMRFAAFQDANNQGLPLAADVAGVLDFTQSRWESFDVGPRGTLDTNFGFEDASVRRYSRVTTADPRMAKVPEVGGSARFNQGQYAQLPKER